MSSPEHDGIGQEPRKVWINKLLNKLDSAYYLIFFGGRTARCIDALEGVILDLDAHSKEKPLAPQLKQLFDYESNPPRSMKELKLIYSHIMSYLHAHQLKEYDRGITDADFERLEKEGSEATEE